MSRPKLLMSVPTDDKYHLSKKSIIIPRVEPINHDLSVRGMLKYLTSSLISKLYKQRLR